MKLSSFVLVTSFLTITDAFVTPNRAPRLHPSTTKGYSKLNLALENLSRVFSDNSSSVSSSSSLSTEPEALINRAMDIAAASMGINDASFLAEDFSWIGPSVFIEGPLGKEEYVAAGQFFYLEGAFPDLDYRAHDFRLDTNDPLTVRFTARMTGTMRGELRLRTETLPPNGKRMICPPEAISMTFDESTGLLSKLCSGFTIDRLIGNTGGLCGVKAAATVAGAPPSEWEIYPITTVIGRFFGRPLTPRIEPETFLAPFPETVMIQLAKGVLSSGTGVEDPSLLSNEFIYSGPLDGPLDKNQFLKKFEKVDLKAAFPDFDENFSNFRVDPYDPYTVRFDSKVTGTWTQPLAEKEPNGKKIKAPAESGSLTFDDDGFCIRMTAGYVMDPTNSNTGGLGGFPGIYYAIDRAQLPVSTRPVSQILARTQKSVLSVFTGVDVDSFSKTSPIIKPNLGKVTGEQLKPQSQVFTPKPPPPRKSSVVESESQKSATDTFASLFKRNSDDETVSETNDRIQEIREMQQNVASKKKAQQEAAAKAKADIAAKQRAMKAKEKKKRETPAIAKTPFKAKAPIKAKVPANAKAPAKAKVPIKAKAPAGVPVIKRWRKNRDGSVTGVITGSEAFSAGERVTTSTIAKGELKAGNVVQTQSGSKYFLD